MHTQYLSSKLDMPKAPDDPVATLHPKMTPDFAFSLNLSEGTGVYGMGGMDSSGSDQDNYSTDEELDDNGMDEPEAVASTCSAPFRSDHCERSAEVQPPSSP